MRDDRHLFPNMFPKYRCSEKNAGFPVFSGSIARARYQRGRRLANLPLPPASLDRLQGCRAGTHRIDKPVSAAEEMAALR
jgi:hypothetical protein